ncbi:MAG: hypothetical protein B7X58_12650 [Marinobacter sp. 34-60-7]|nr:MAG: hypothetical protein B7X58_12650 [Marinobacter sp. 34-60-7]
MAKPQAEAGQRERVQSLEPVTSKVGIEMPEALDVTEPATEELQELLPVTGGALSAATVERCCIQGWLGERFAIIAYLSEQSSLSMQETLALNILKSLGDDVSNTVGPVRWPLFNNLRVGLNHATHLQGVLRDLFASCTDKTVVSLGDANDLLSEALGKPVDVRFVPGVAELAGDPALKRELWHQIKRLVVSG